MFVVLQDGVWMGCRGGGCLCGFGLIWANLFLGRRRVFLGNADVSHSPHENERLAPARTDQTPALPGRPKVLLSLTPLSSCYSGPSLV